MFIECINDFNKWSKNEGKITEFSYPISIDRMDDEFPGYLIDFVDNSNPDCGVVTTYSLDDDTVTKEEIRSYINKAKKFIVKNLEV